MRSFCRRKGKTVFSFALGFRKETMNSFRENNYENGKFHITGEFEKVNSPSEYLRTLLTRSGVPLELLNQF